jgi:mycothiol synthase
MDAPQVTRCSPDDRAAALRLLHAATSREQEALAQSIAATSPDGAEWDGLFTAGNHVATDAIWVQLTPGNTAVVWPPKSSATASADALLSAAAEFVDERGLDLAQIIVSSEDGFSPQRFEASGFPKLAELIYLYSDLPSSGNAQPRARFAPHAGADLARLTALVERTYVGTQDCPALDGMRSVDDVLAGYRSQGTHMPEHWYTIRSVEDETDDASADADGVLILADHPSAGNWELVYMGVAPAARGRRWGEEIVRFAQQTSALHGAQRLILAVDAANSPAVSMYHRTGFVEWDRRTIYARLGRRIAARS